jgi:predicted amidophosphoribosyltransferase
MMNAVQAPARPVAPAAQPGALAKFCQDCGLAIPRAARFCPECGKPQATQGS